jgi:hemerythrin
MAYFEWGDDLAVGNSLIDHDHQGLIKLVNDLHDATQKGEGRSVVEGILNELLAYTQSHFQREEFHMAQVRYAAIDAHKLEHVAILKQILALQQQFAMGDITVATKVSAILRDWLSIHIMRSDKAFAKLINVSTP